MSTHTEKIIDVDMILGTNEAQRNVNLNIEQKNVLSDNNVMFGNKDEQDEMSKMEMEKIEESHSEEVFSAYKCESLPTSYSCTKHPGNIVEAGSLAAQRLPDATYNLLSTLSGEVIEEGKLSDLQFEGILFACQRHQLILPDGNRAGFFLGDGTGVGKGRQIAGMILDNLCRGRKRHIWFSISSDLRIDAERDLNDIGCYVNVIDGCQELDRGLKAFGLVSTYQSGVLFSTYSTLVSYTQKGGAGKSSRLDQLISWCGKDFDGCLIFDESHKAKHFVPGKEKSSTKVAVAVTTIQRLLPQARVVYCSATGVTDVKNMAFMERLGLWGAGTTFNDFESFLYSLTMRGLGALEMLSMEMKAAGMYVSRGLSYQEAEFKTIEASLTDEQIKVYNKAVLVWKELKRTLAIAYQRVGNYNPRNWTQFWACHQRFFKQLCMSMKVPEIVKQTKEALHDGYAVVIGLQTTGEASMDSELNETNGKISAFISLTREILRRFISQFFPTAVITKEGEEKQVDKWCVEAKSLLLDYAGKIKLPDSPLDSIIDELGGPNCVAEMTGRSGFIGRYKRGDVPRYILRQNHSKSTETVSVRERNSFMNGDKLVAIISDAASTGISLHADSRVKNTRRRVHITAELPWSADKAVQQLGRSHRSNQSSGPIYKLLTSNLGGERRFAAAVARRLQSLGALTKGDRRAATGSDLTQFNFDTNYGRQSLKIMYEAIMKQQICSGVRLEDVLRRAMVDCALVEFHETMMHCIQDMDVVEKNMLGTIVMEKHLKDIGKFLNRILGLDVHKQNLIFSYFVECLDATTNAAKREGKFNDGVSDIRGNSITKCGDATIVFKDAQIGASVTRHVFVLVDRGVSFEEALLKYDANKLNESGFFRSKREQYGRKLFLLAIQKERSTHLFTVTRPNTGASAFEEERGDLLRKYERIQPNVAEQGWKEQYEMTHSNCIHGDKCKHKGSCQIGCRLTEMHLLTGRILSILPVLEAVVAKFAHSLQLPRELRNLRVVRMELDDGDRLVGLRYPEVLIGEAERHLTEQKLLLQQRSGQSSGYRVEVESSVDEKTKMKVFTKPTTIENFFQKTNYVDSPSCPANTTVKSKPSMVCTRKPKRKQPNLFSMLQSQGSKKKKRNESVCPICARSFEGLANPDVNKHIDSCLIE